VDPIAYTILLLHSLSNSSNVYICFTIMNSESTDDGLGLLARALVIKREGYNRNPSGRNQFQDCPKKEDTEFQNLLRKYHKRTTNRSEVRELLERFNGIHVSERTITRRWREMGLRASKATEANLPRAQVIQLVLDQMAIDPSKRTGQNALKTQIALRTGLHLRRDTIADVQRTMDPQGALSRNPTFRQIRRIALTSEGPNDVWCCDGHDKLVGIIKRPLWHCVTTV